MCATMMNTSTLAKESDDNHFPAHSTCAGGPGLLQERPSQPASALPARSSCFLRVYCVLDQVNTSGEESKYGVQPNECAALARHIRDTCTHLRFAGLMTIGQPDYSSRPENFQVFTYTLKPNPKF